MVAIEAIKESNGKYLAYTDNGREYTGIEVFDWASKVAKLGAGEIVITSVDNEGTGRGYDIELVSGVAKSVSIPVIAHGGAGKIDHVIDVFKKSRANSAMVSSLFHYHFIRNNKSNPSIPVSYTHLRAQRPY